MNDFGYDISNFTDIAPVFGTLKDIEDLLKEAHNIGLKVKRNEILRMTIVDLNRIVQHR